LRARPDRQLRDACQYKSLILKGLDTQGGGESNWHMPCTLIYSRSKSSMDLHPGNRETGMSRAILQDWTDSRVRVRLEQHRDVRYQVYRESDSHFLEMRETGNDAHIHTLELPDGMRLDRSSYEVLLRYVLLDVVAA
jgi:hypothetical protein